MQNRSFGGKQRRSAARKGLPLAQGFEAAPWELPDDFPLHVVDYRMTRTQAAEFHIHNVLEIGWCRSGRGIFMIEDAAIPFTAGDVFVISNLEAHSAYSLPHDPSEWSFIFVDPARIAGPSFAAGLFDFSGNLRNHFRATEGTDAALCETVRQIVDEYRRQPPFFREAIRSHVARIVVECRRIPGDARQMQRRSFTAMKALEPALEKIAQQYNRTIEMQELARACHMSGSHFRRVFTAQLGSSPKDYLLAYRVGMAAGLLASTDKRISQIAAETGFETLSSFNRQFLRRKGCSPRQWRQSGGITSPPE